MRQAHERSGRNVSYFPSSPRPPACTRMGLGIGEWVPQVLGRGFWESLGTSEESWLTTHRVGVVQKTAVAPHGFHDGTAFFGQPMSMAHKSCCDPAG
jgi:hypothetical protein